MKKKLTENLSTKIISLVCAIFLWAYVIDEVNPTVRREFHDIPISYLNQESLKDHDLTLVDTDSQVVNLTVRAKRSDIQQIRPDDLVATVDLSGYEEGTHRLPIRVSAPSGVRVDDSSFKTVTVKIERLLEASFDVEVVTKNKVPNNIIVESMTSNPKKVKVREPSSVMDQIGSVKAEIDLPSRGDNEISNTQLKVYDKEGKEMTDVSTNPSFVNVAIITSFSKEVPIELKYQGQLPKDLKLVEGSISPSKVFIKSDRSDMADIKSISTEAIDLSSFTGSVSGKAKLVLPENVHLVDSNQTFDYQINVEKKMDKAISLPLDRIKIENLSQGLEASLKGDANVDLVISGFPGQVEDLNEDNLEVSIDLKDISEGGNYDIPLSVKLPEEVELKSSQPDRVSVDIN